MTVLVTGAGGPAGIAVIRALAMAGMPTVGVDADAGAVGLRLAEDQAVIPRADAEGYGPSLVEVARTKGATALICTVAEEMAAVGVAAEALAEAGVAVWLPTNDSVKACIDKWEFAQRADRADITIPATGLGKADGIPGPWIVKPRFGRGSRDILQVDDLDELNWALGRVPNPIVQTRVCGSEFTVDALVDRDGVLRSAVPRYRVETRGGISTRGVTFRNPDVEDGVERLLGCVGLRGVANAQGFVTPDGEVVFIEINPRFSGGLPLSLAAGADLVGQYLRLIRGLPVEPNRLSFRAGVTMMRHFVEVFE
ncbi:MAG: ATP-grasp domain-containing protein [Actinomycetia bacterium]|nr:ATP-grasp domain-containing protein [Actinomycetes bacterium]MCP4222565.1 ATP-grasp domain-containing protein [Actinomycetes bacterium]MCP5033344.1 ATP-grasp domain-containing protein [Actinomycetes bacterium]